MPGRRVRDLTAGLLGLLAISAVAKCNAEALTLAWDGVADPRVATYQLQYWSGGTAKIKRVAAPQTSAVVDELQRGVTYRFAVRACDLREVTCSVFSNVVCASVPVTPGLPVRECPPSLEEMLEALPDRGGWRSILW